MSPLERLLAEEWPTGLFGGSRTPAPAPAPCRDEAAAQHRADLEAAIYRRPRTGQTSTHRKDTP
ncbi:hypothetical protein [Streptomyces sp. NPDC059538]|uniref:hypothetical protein n=1 Tax=Streptomyces sp. NPDC059538 TaxID=3346860 RepID=UPI00368FF8B3